MQPVCHVLEPCKVAESIEMPFGNLTLWVRGTIIRSVKMPHEKGQFWGLSSPAHWKALGVSAAVYAGKGIIQCSIMAQLWDCCSWLIDVTLHHPVWKIRLPVPVMLAFITIFLPLPLVFVFVIVIIRPPGITWQKAYVLSTLLLSSF